MSLHLERLGKNICYYRNKKDLTQKQLAEMVGCATEDMSRYENGRRKIPLTTLNSICEVLDVSIEEMFTGITDARLHANDDKEAEDWVYKEFARITSGCFEETVRSILNICAQILDMPKG